MTPSSRSRRSRKSAPRWICARNAGTSLSAASHLRWARATTSSMVSGASPKRHTGAASIVMRSLIPEGEEIEPVQRGLDDLEFQPAREALRLFGQCGIARTARQHYALGELFEGHPIAVALVQARHRVDRAAERGRQHVGPD